jgi:hypothetical protein
MALACGAVPPGISAPMALEYGKAADAAALQRLIALEDPALVYAFGSGLDVANRAAMPPDVEALVVANFDHPRVGAALRTFSRYRTRALFDLHYKRIEAAYRNDDPSFEQILRTDLAGIEAPLMKVAPKFAPRIGEPNPALVFLGRRKYPAAAPLLIASLEDSYRAAPSATAYNVVLAVLMEYPSVEVWRQTRDELDRLRREGRIAAQAHATARKSLDAVLEDPAATLAQYKRRDSYAAFERARDALSPNAREIEALRSSDPRRYASLYSEYAAKLERIVAGLDDPQASYEVANAYYRLGMFVRFQLRDPQRAATLLEKSAPLGYALGQLALADTYQFDLGDKARALQAYRRALEEATKPTRRGLPAPYSATGSPANEFWKAWLAAEVRFLETGQPFRGAIGEAAIGGFFLNMYGWLDAVTPFFEAELPMPAAPANAAAVEKLPASRLALMAAMRHASLLPDAARVLQSLERNDPSGYWTTCMLGTVEYFAGQGVAGRDEALRSGAAQFLPGIVADGNPNALGDAAQRFMRARNLGVRPQAAAR